MESFGVRALDEHTLRSDVRMSIPESVREDLARRARNKKVRQSKFKPEAPCDWRPGQVLTPESGLPFSDAGAWNFIADLLEAGHEVTTLILEKPPGKTAYVMVAKGYSGCPNIYIKLTMSRNIINGRSFHDSEF